MRVLLVLILFVFCFGDCKITKKAENDMIGANFINSKFIFFDTKKLFVKNNSFKNLFFYTSKVNNIVSVKMLRGGGFTSQF